MAAVQVKKVNYTSTASATSHTVNFGGTVAAGNKILLVVTSNATVGTPSGYSVAASAVNSVGHYHFYKDAAGSETSVVLAPGVSGSCACTMFEYSGMTAGAPDKTATNTTGSGAGWTTGTTATTVQADELLIGSNGATSGTTMMPITGWSNSFSAESGIYTSGTASGGNANTGVGSRIVAATGAYTTTPTFTGSSGGGGHSGIITAWKIAAAGGTTLAPTSGATTFSGNVPAVPEILAPSSGAVTFAGNAPTIIVGTFLTPTVGTVTVAGQVPVVQRILVPSTGAVTWAGQVPALGNTQEIAFDSASAVQAFTGTRSSDSWSYLPTGTIRSVVLLAITGNNSDIISGCTYGGVAMTRPSGGSVADNVGEPLRSYVYHLGSGIPAGAQTVVINYTLSHASPFRAIVLGFTAAGDVEVLSVGMQGGDAANPSRTPTKSGRVGLTVGVLASGHDDLTSTTPAAGLTEAAGTDVGTFTGSFVYQTDADAVDTAAAWTASTEDTALVAISIGQSVPAGLTPGSGTVAVDGQEPAFGGTVLTPSAGVATFSGQVPAVARILAPAAGVATFSGNTPTLVISTVLTPTAGAVTFAGQAPSIQGGTVLAPSAGLVTWTGKVPRVIDQYPDVTLSWTAPVGWTPTEYRVKIGTSPGVYTTTIDVPGSQTSVDVYGLSYNVRYYWTVVGLDASDVEQEVAPEGNFMLMMPITGGVTFTGQVPVLPKTLAAVSGAVTWVGNFPSVQSGAGTFLTPATGVTTFAGQVPSISKMLAPAAGAAIFTGQTPNFLTGNFLAPAAGLVTFSGFAPTVPRFITPSAGLATWTGQTPSISLAVTLTPSSGLVTWTGNAPEIRGALLPAAGSVIWTGNRPAISQGAQDVVPRFGGDDAPGWQKAEWRKRRAKELAMEEDIRALYRKLRGVPELKEEAAAVVQEIMPARPARKSRPEPDWRMLSAEMERALREIELRRLELQFEYDELAAILILTALA